MYITSDYLAISTKGYKCAFYMLYEDYIQTQMRFMQDLSLLLQRFARDLGRTAPLIVPFMDDIKEVKNNILDKNWNEQQLNEIRNMPGMLMIDVEFEKFDPQSNRWIYFYFDEEKDSIKEIERLLKDLSDIAKNAKCDIFQEVSKVRMKHITKDLEKLIEIKPEIKGVSVDLKEAIKMISEIKSILKCEKIKK